MAKGIKKSERVPEIAPVSLGELIHAQVRGAIEAAVHEELAAALGAAPYERSGTRRGYRNGVKSRTLTGPTGPLALTLPRGTLFAAAGEQEWTSALLPRYQRRGREVNEAVVGTYLAGGNTRRIRGALQPLLKAAPLSKSAVSRVVATLKDGLAAWRARSLAELDVVSLDLDALALRVRCAGKVVSVPVLTAVAVLADSQKQLLALELCSSESAEAWHGFGAALPARDLKAPLLCIIDGNPGLQRAVERVWPRAAVQRCCVHTRRNLERKAPTHALDDLREDFHRIVYAASGDAARAAYTTFERTWATRGPGVVRSLQEGGRRAAHRLPLPHGAVEDAAPHHRHRAAQRRVPPAREDARLPADRGRGAEPALRPRRERAGHAPQDRRRHDDRGRHQHADAASGMSTRWEGYPGVARAPIVAPEPKAGRRFQSVLP